MAVNILKLKQQKLRKSFRIGDDVVEVYNITNENRSLFEKVFEQSMNHDTGEISLTDEALLLAIYTSLTNIEFTKPEEVIEALESPSIELEQINNEIRMVITEYANIKIQEQLVKIQELDMLFNQAQLTGYTEDVAKRAGVDISQSEKEAQEKLTGMRSSKKAGAKNGKKTNKI